MSNIANTIGERIRIYRNKAGYSQEVLAEKASVHPTYIGQIERGEKNATLESIEKICIALKLPFEVLFEKIIKTDENYDDKFLDEIYRLLKPLSNSQKKSIYEIIKESGPAHQKTYVSQVSHDGKILGCGSGKTKKDSEQQAAIQAINKLS